MKIISIFLAAASLAVIASARAWEFSSGPERVGLLELYTSEGGSSCPPADAWLGTFRDSAELWKTIVPIAFHVDYWDRLGWPDKFAEAEFTTRQHDYATAWNASTVYTPGVVFDGDEIRNWRGFRPEPSGLPGVLKAASEGDRVDVRFDPVGAFDSGVVLIAWQESGVASAVRAGENSGRRLEHNFVATRMESAPLEETSDGIWTATLLNPATDGATSVAIWISALSATAPIQATGGPL